MQFVTQACVALAGYSDDVIEHVCAPETGLQRTQKFAPVLAEIVEACERRVKALAHQAELDAWRERKRRSDEAKKLGARYSVENRPPGVMNYGEFLAYCEANNIEAKPMSRFETAQYMAGLSEKKDGE